MVALSEGNLCKFPENFEAEGLFVHDKYSLWPILAQSFYLKPARQLEILVTVPLSYNRKTTVNSYDTGPFFFTWKTWCYRGWG
jgi:hypothetical protein